MRIFCSYNDNYDIFLKQIVEYTLARYKEDLNISCLMEIELVDIKEFSFDTDGRIFDEGKKIVLTSRLFDMLPTLEIDELYDNKDFKMIVNTLYHEMGHISDWKKYPNLYKYATDDEAEIQKMLPAYFWVEYIAERRSDATGEIPNNDFCESFVSRIWHAYMFDYEHVSENNYFYLCKVLIYFMAKTHNPKERRYYIGKLKNELLVEYINEMGECINILEKQMPFDDVELLSPLYEIMDKYYKKFRLKYKPR